MFIFSLLLTDVCLCLLRCVFSFVFTWEWYWVSFMAEMVRLAVHILALSPSVHRCNATHVAPWCTIDRCVPRTRQSWPPNTKNTRTATGAARQHTTATGAVLKIQARKKWVCAGSRLFFIGTWLWDICRNKPALKNSACCRRRPPRRRRNENAQNNEYRSAIKNVKIKKIEARGAGTPGNRPCCSICGVCEELCVRKIGCLNSGRKKIFFLRF